MCISGELQVIQVFEYETNYSIEIEFFIQIKVSKSFRDWR